jgi:hypothetical protein
MQYTHYDRAAGGFVTWFFESEKNYSAVLMRGYDR